MESTTSGCIHSVNTQDRYYGELFAFRMLYLPKRGSFTSV